MKLSEKLLQIQMAVDAIIKDGQNQSDRYDFASDENVLNRFRPLMDQHKLLLIPLVTAAQLHEGTTKSGTSRYLTELTLTMAWLDTETGERMDVPWYSQGVDLAGEKGVGKALTYAEKYFLLKFFHVPTKKDDPDGQDRTRSGELRQRRGSQAARENAAYYRMAIPQMLGEIYNGDGEKIRAAYLSMTKAESRGYQGADSIEAISDAALPVVYGRVKTSYESRLGHSFTLQENDHAC